MPGDTIEITKWDTVRFIDDTLKHKIEEQIHLFFSALMHGQKWTVKHGEFEQYDYCKHKTKQFCGLGEKMPVALHINEYRFLEKNLLDCKMAALKAFLQGSPWHPTFRYDGELKP